jgi:Domain of unknown function (DUF4412)
MSRWVVAMGMAMAASVAAMGGARAAAVITVESSGSDGQTAPGETIYLEANHLRMSRPNGAMIYREDLSKVWAIDDANHSYREITPETMEQMQAAMNQAMARMQQQLQSMPEDQRKRVEAMLHERGMSTSPNPAPPPPLKYAKAGAARTVGKWSCTPYRVTGVVEGDTGHEEFCIARLKDVGLTRDDLQPLESLGKFMEKMGPRGGGMQAFDFAAQTKAIGFEGIPIQTTHYGNDGKVDSRTTITSVAQKSVSPSDFELPAGYVKQEMSFGHAPPPGHGP